MEKKILVIEDNPAINELMVMVLESEGFVVESSFKTFHLSELQNMHPDAIVLDNWLEGESGSEFCKLVKSDEALKDTPVIMVSAVRNLKEVADDCRADFFIEKPFNIDELTEAVKKYA